MLTTLEAPAPDCTETLISIHLLLPAEQKSRPELTLAQLKEELCRNTKYTIAARPLPHFTREDETKLAPIQKVKTISPVPVAINVDGVDMTFDAIVVLEGHFPQELYLGRQEPRCYNIGVQDAQGEARIDESCLWHYLARTHSIVWYDRHRFRSFYPFTLCIPKDSLSPRFESSPIRYPTVCSQRQNHKHHWHSRKRKFPIGWSFADYELHSHRRPLGSRGFPIRPQLSPHL